MSYKRNATNNRDALFGGIAPAGPSSNNNRRTPAAAAPPTTTTTTTRGTSTLVASSSAGYDRTKSKKSAATLPSLSGAAREAKFKEAKDCQEKANACMERGFFKKADPVAASTFYKRSADAYKAIGDIVNERYMRISSADTNMMITAYASAASDYTRAAELLLLLQQNDENNNDETKNQQIRRDASNLHKKAAEAWKQMNETGKSATSMVAAAIALNKGGASGRLLSKEAIGGIEEAIESFVPDPLNPYARYRQTGHSAFIEEDSEETIEACSAETKELAKQHIVTRAYSHEPVQELITLLIQYGEYASALYAAGAVTTLLESDGVSTLSLCRAYVTETILALAMGDPILAEQQFLQRHVQKTFYLQSRECQLADELYRAVKNRDTDALDNARSPTGPNRASLANLSNDAYRQVVQDLRTSGVARSTGPKPTSSASTTDPNNNNAVAAADTAGTPASLNDLLQMKTGYEQDVQEGAAFNPNELADELDNLDFGDDDKDSDGGVGGGDELDVIEDDDFDLR